MGVVIIINFPYSTCISSFFSSSIPSLLLCSFFKCFFGLVSVIFLQFFGLVSVIFLQYIANVTQKTFEIVQKNRDPANIIIKFFIISIIMNVERASTARVRASPETSMCEVPMTFD